ncbi:hypothetical protein OG799_18755 [Micromonospora sp. NBC_00898]|uniref:hypothetical protein n=1 Tax=Micromonospora sp. NBC_00898 TaxID=2975981 RepID=UPI00386EF331|nr:hypothetical protein OG799_18755 [Micromonospora sp. NBC_00898]
MSLLTSLARAHAVDQSVAQRLTTVRHLHISSEPLVFVPLAMAGESHAPLAVMMGTSRERYELLTVAQPRNRDQQMAFAHQLARIFTGYIGPRTNRRLPLRAGASGVQYRCADAPQVWVPNRAGIEFMRVLGRSTRFRAITGEWAVPPNIPSMGKWLTFLADRAEYAGSCMLVAATDALALHWATGQSDTEDQHLAAVLGWISPPPGMTGRAAARASEDPLEVPPAGPATDPSFDNGILEPLLAAYHEASSPAASRIAEVKIRKELQKQLAGTWERMWQAIALLRDPSLPIGAHVGVRWERDLDAFTRTAEWIATSPGAQPKRDSAVYAARRLYWLERAQQQYDAERAFDDEMVMAEARMVGDAFVGTVVAAEANRRVGRSLRPLISVATTDAVSLTVGETGLRRPDLLEQKATVVSSTRDAGTVIVELELREGMGRGREPQPGTVPALGDTVCYSRLNDDYRRPPTLPNKEDTPWTHGGPPEPYMPTEQDAQEPWS